MPDFIQLPPDGGGKRLLCTYVVVDGVGVYLENDRITGADGSAADVRAGEPGASDAGLVVRLAPPVSPQRQEFENANLAATATDTFTCAAIAGATGGLLKVSLSSTGLVRWTIQAPGKQLGVRITNGGSDDYEPPSKWHDTTITGGQFDVVAQNVGPMNSEVYCTVWWDEF